MKTRKTPANPKKGPAGKKTGKPEHKHSPKRQDRKSTQFSGTKEDAAGDLRGGKIFPRGHYSHASKRKERKQGAALIPKTGRQHFPKEGIRLNKYLSNAGIAARRKCDELIAAGHVKVNGKIIPEMGYKVMPGDRVSYRGKIVIPVRPVYILLNKPSGFITTVEDERGRKTVMSLIAQATQERVYPVGRLDRNTTGLLLLTNDGELAQKLSHPSHGAQKVYFITLDKPVTARDMEAIAGGIELEDGKALVDEIAWPDPLHKEQVGITLHIGKNRIVRRIFEHLGYSVLRLDRTAYAGLTKRDLPRGRWRFLSEREIIRLKYLK